jgi:hypothetical protein
MTSKPRGPEEIGALDLACPACGWRGKGAEAEARPDDQVRCPRCGAAVEKTVADPCFGPGSFFPPMTEPFRPRSKERASGEAAPSQS